MNLQNNCVIIEAKKPGEGKTIFLKTDRLIVRKFQKNDLAALFQLLSNENVMRYIEPPYSMEQTESFLHNVALREPPILYAVEDKSGRFIGYIIYHPYSDISYENPETGTPQCMETSYEIGWILAAEQWHKGYARELLNALIKDAAGRAKCLVIECSPAQNVTKHLALSSGFSYAGLEDGCEIYRMELPADFHDGKP